MGKISKNVSVEDNISKLEEDIKPQRLREFLKSKYYDEKLNCIEIAELLNISAATVRRYMRYFDLQLKYRGQAIQEYWEAKKRGEN